MSRSNELPDFEDKFAMLDLLTKYLLSTGAGFYYKPDWSDLRVAKVSNPARNFKAHHAATIRRAKFGKLVAPPEPTPPPPDRLTILEARLTRIIDHLAGNSPRTAQYRRYLLDGHTTTAHLDDI